MGTLNLVNQFQVNRTLLLAKDSGDLQNRNLMWEANAVAVWLHLTYILDYSAFFGICFILPGKIITLGQPHSLGLSRWKMGRAGKSPEGTRLTLG